MGHDISTFQFMTPFAPLLLGLSIIMHPGSKIIVEENGRLQAKRNRFSGAKTKIQYEKALLH